MRTAFLRRAAGAAMAVTIGLGSSCCNSRARDVQPAKGAGVQPAPPPVAADAAWSLRIGSQGGFTGGGSGHLLRSDGTVTKWSRITPQDSITTAAAGTASTESIQALQAALESLGASRTEYTSTGNMTVFMEWMAAPVPRRWSWPEGPSGAKIPDPVQRVYAAALAAIASARPAH